MRVDEEETFLPGGIAKPQKRVSFVNEVPKYLLCIAIGVFGGLILSGGPDDLGTKLHPEDVPAPILSQQKADLSSVLIVTATHPEPCTSQHGDFMITRLMMTKMDYCVVHGCTVFGVPDQLVEEVKDAECAGCMWSPRTFNKVHLLKKLIESQAYKRFEWFLWMDADTAIVDFNRVPDLAALEAEKIWYLIDGPSLDEVFYHKINTGVILIKNCEWSLSLLDTILNVMNLPSERIYAAIPDMKTVEIDDQGATAYVLKTNPRNVLQGHAFVGSTKFYSQMYWKDVEQRVDKETGKIQLLPNDSPRQMAARLDAEATGEPLQDTNLVYYAFCVHFVSCQPCTSVMEYTRREDGWEEDSFGARCVKTISDVLELSTRSRLSLLSKSGEVSSDFEDDPLLVSAAELSQKVIHAALYTAADAITESTQ